MKKSNKNIKKNIINFYFKYWRISVLFLVAIIFTIGTSYYNFSTQEYAQNADQVDFVKWMSPDETANYVFTKLYAQEGKLFLFEKYNLYTNDIMRPRSFRSDWGEIKPVSFLGIILIYGTIASLTTYKIIPFLTPILAGLGIIFYYLFLKRIFGKKNAFISAMILASFPPYIYYTSRSMFHNVLLVVLLVFAFYFGVLMIQKKVKKHTINWLGMFYAALFGCFLGLAVITRTSELLWIAPLLFVLWLFNIKRIGFVRLLIAISFAFFAILPVLYNNQILYGNPFFGGYAEMNQSIINIAEASTGVVSSTATGNISSIKEYTLKIKDSIFHFGFHNRHSLKMFDKYFIEMFYWLFLMVIMGLSLSLMFVHRMRKKFWAYLISVSIISVVLVYYYGSWEFHDNPDPNSFTIGNSYTRYWLPVYMGIIPMSSLFLIKFSRAISIIVGSKKYYRRIVVGLVQFIFVAIIMFVSIKYVATGSEEGLKFAINKQQDVKSEWSRVLNLTEQNSTIITTYHDKLFFPERKVIMGDFSDQSMIQQYRKLTNYLPVYYYNFSLPQASIDYLNNRRLAENGLQIKEIEKINDEFTLYKIYLKK